MQNARSGGKKGKEAFQSIYLLLKLGKKKWTLTGERRKTCQRRRKLIILETYTLPILTFYNSMCYQKRENYIINCHANTRFSSTLGISSYDTFHDVGKEYQFPHCTDTITLPPLLQHWSKATNKSHLSLRVLPTSARNYKGCVWNVILRTSQNLKLFFPISILFGGTGQTEPWFQIIYLALPPNLPPNLCKQWKQSKKYNIAFKNTDFGLESQV